MIIQNSRRYLIGISFIIYQLSFSVALTSFSVVLTSCNSNDDTGAQAIQIPGITIEADADCCTAEEALQVYNFVQTVKIVPQLTTVVDGKYQIFAYTRGGTFHTGYNEVYFVANKKSSGNYVRNFTISTLTPLMFMEAMNMKHSTPVSATVEGFDADIPAVKRGWVSFVMGGQWTLDYQVSILGVGGSSSASLDVSPLADGQQWLKSFKVGEATYYLTLADPTGWLTGSNEIRAYISLKSAVPTEPYTVAKEQFVVEIDPRMPDMGNHTSPDNTPLTRQADGSYLGSINLTMTGLWRIHLTVKDTDGRVIAGGDDLVDGYSSLYWDVTI